MCEEPTYSWKVEPFIINPKTADSGNCMRLCVGMREKQENNHTTYEYVSCKIDMGVSQCPESKNCRVLEYGGSVSPGNDSSTITCLPNQKIENNSCVSIANKSDCEAVNTSEVIKVKWVEGTDGNTGKCEQLTKCDKGYEFVKNANDKFGICNKIDSNQEDADATCSDTQTKDETTGECRDITEDDCKDFEKFKGGKCVSLSKKECEKNPALIYATDENNTEEDKKVCRARTKEECEADAHFRWVPDETTSDNGIDNTEGDVVESESGKCEKIPAPPKVFRRNAPQRPTRPATRYYNPLNRIP